MLTDLSKAFDCLSQELLVAKLIAYGVEISSVRLIYDYLTNGKQKTKFGNDYSFWRDILSGVKQRSVLDPLLFNIYICDMFFLLKDMHVANYADGTTPYIYDKNLGSVIKSLEQSVNLLFNWFKSNQLKGNEDKCHVWLSTDETVQVNIGTANINNGKCEKLLGIKIDCKLSFDDHIGNICKKLVQN